MNNPSTDRTTVDAEPGTGVGVWTEHRIRALGAVTDLPTAGRVFGLGRSLAYALVRAEEFPAPVIRVGTRYRVPVAGILTALGINAGGGDLTSSATSSVDHHDAIRTTATPDLPGIDRGEL